jgi:hypothetical protein
VTTSIDYDAIATTLTKAGLVGRGGFQVAVSDCVPTMESGNSAKSVVLVGNIGGSLWPSFAAAHPKESADNESHPTLLDDWSRHVLTEVAETLGGLAACMPLFPFEGPPFLPFIRWAQKAEAVISSPIGPLIHPNYGLWHAYRGALAFAYHVPLPEPEERQKPCDTCMKKPCLSGCPVSVHEHDAFDLSRCMDHVVTDVGSPCMANGCLARQACPVGSEFRYTSNQAHFHMVAFRRANRRMRD